MGQVFVGYGHFFKPPAFPVYTVPAMAALVASCVYWIMRPSRSSFSCTILTGCGLLGFPALYLLLTHLYFGFSRP